MPEAERRANVGRIAVAPPTAPVDAGCSRVRWPGCCIISHVGTRRPLPHISRHVELPPLRRARGKAPHGCRGFVPVARGEHAREVSAISRSPRHAARVAGIQERGPGRTRPGRTRPATPSPARPSTPPAAARWAWKTRAAPGDWALPPPTATRAWGFAARAACRRSPNPRQRGRTHRTSPPAPRAPRRASPPRRSSS